MRRTTTIIFLCLAAGLAAQWQPETALTTNATDQNTGGGNGWNLAASGDTLHTVWVDERDLDYEIYYKRSTDGGLTWGADTRLTLSSGISNAVTLAAAGDQVYIVWSDQRNGNFNSELYFKGSVDGGATWGADMRLTTDAEESEEATLAVEGNTLHLAWMDTRSGNYEIYYLRSPNGGLTWDPLVQLTNDPAAQKNAAIAVQGNSVQLAYIDFTSVGNVVHTRSNDGGTSWEPAVQLTFNTTYTVEPTIAVSGSNVHLAWSDQREYATGDFEIFYRRSTDAGASWGPDVRLTTALELSKRPSIAASGSFVHLAWHDERNGEAEIYYKRSMDDGANWAADLRLTNEPAPSIEPSVCTSGSVVHLVWQDEREGNWDVFHAMDPAGNAVGVMEFTAQPVLLIAPNPVDRSFTLQCSDLLVGTRITVRDMTGREVRVPIAINTNKAVIDASVLSPGTYTITARTTAGTITQRFMKEQP